MSSTWPPLTMKQSTARCCGSHARHSTGGSSDSSRGAMPRVGRVSRLEGKHRPCSAHPMRPHLAIRLAGASGFLGVAFGAFGAHLLRGSLTTADLGIWQTAVLYHLVHSVVLLALAVRPEVNRWI